MLSFKQFIQESPHITPNLLPHTFKPRTDDLTKYLQENHKNSEKLFDTDVGAIHRLHYGPANIYYHYTDGNPREHAIIYKDSDIQRRIDKNGGSGKYIAQMTKHHAKEFGRVRSDDVQSIGGMKFWKKLYKQKDPNYSFHHEINHGTQNNPKYKEIPIDDEYLKVNSDNIFSDNMEHGQKQRMVIRRK